MSLRPYDDSEPGVSGGWLERHDPAADRIPFVIELERHDRCTFKVVRVPSW
jgi:hypothetical protein